MSPSQCFLSTCLPCPTCFLPDSTFVLISKALPPLPVGTQLPAGKMEILVATVITPEEMHWSMKNGRGALLQKLREAGVGQVSKPGRESVVL